MSDKPKQTGQEQSESQIDIGDVEGGIHGSTLSGRDAHVHGDQIKGDKYEVGTVSDDAVAVFGRNSVVNIYQGIPARQVSQADADAAIAKLGELPLDKIPDVATLPSGSNMPLSHNPLFVGREDELRVLAAWLKGGQTAAVGQTAAATGMGGIGKTQLAAAFVHRYGQFFQGGVFWVSMADPASVPAEIVECGKKMPELSSGYGSLEFEIQLRLVLAAWQSELPRLLVFDNCEEPDLLAQWRPSTGGCRVLVFAKIKARQ